MRRINCRSVRREIETASSSKPLSSLVGVHMESCSECETFRAERVKLRKIISGLGVVEAPGDFDFRLRARLAREKRVDTKLFAMPNLSFGIRSAAFATILLLIASALVYVSLRSPEDKSLSSQSEKESSKNPAMAAIQGADKEPQNKVADVPPTDQKKEEFPQDNRVATKSMKSERGVAVVRHGRIKSRDMGTTPAKVITPANPPTGSTSASGFPIGASYQSLKVSLDDGRGRSRTISLPSVSFGSQRVLAQSTSPLIVSARDTW